MVNTGWSGGRYGIGSRIRIPYTRAMVNAAIAGALDDVPYVEEPFFGLQVPTAVPGVPSELLMPRSTWADPAQYDIQASKLAGMFFDNFETYVDGVEPRVANAGPQI